MSEASDIQAAKIHYFVDEAGDPTLFNDKGRIIVGTEGCSRYFILGKLDVDDPVSLTTDLEALRKTILADPYFKGVASLQPARKKTARMFHAKDDVPEVRREVFKLLLGRTLRFYAVVRDKRELVSYVRQQNERDPNYHYSENESYDSLVSHLFRSRFYKADHFDICFSKRGQSDRTAALKKALERAVAEYERDFGVTNKASMKISNSTPPGVGGLQAVDYFMWAFQRFYERADLKDGESESRYIEMLGGMIGEINELDLLHDGKRGVLWGPNRPLTLAARMEMVGAEKKPGI